MKTLSQSIVVARLGLRSLPQRQWTTISTLVSIALVVVVLLGFLSMAEGFRATVNGAGDPGVAVILQKGAPSETGSAIGPEQLRALEEAPGLLHRDGKAQLSPEVTMVTEAPGGDGERVNLLLRGIEPGLATARTQARIASGRMLRAGSNEIVVGRAISREFPKMALGRTIRLGGREWKVAGEFADRGSVLESEIWADRHVVAQLSNRGAAVQIVRARLETPRSLARLNGFLDRDPRFTLEARGEPAYFAAQGARTGDIVMRLGWPLALCLSIGALAGAANAMYASVSARTVELLTLRAIGFSRRSVFAGTMVESAAVTAAGAVVGLILAWAGFDGIRSSTLGSNFAQVIFEFRLSRRTLVQAVELALLIGLIGGFFPALRAARQPLVARPG